jgi:hypothetical protein
MPAEGQPIQQGYLHRILVNGTKPFRYRSGIRTLLGVPSSLDARIAYPLPLPPAGFNYLRTAALNGAGVEAPRVFSESILPETGRPEAQARFQRPETGAPRMEVPVSTRRSNQPPGATRPTPVTPADRKAERPDVATSDAEESRIDIPGASQRQVRFPALTSQSVDEPPMPKAPQKDSGILPNKDRSTSPVTSKMPGGTPSSRVVGVDGFNPPRPHPIRDGAGFKRANPETLVSRPEIPQAGRPAPVAEQPAKDAAPYRIVSSLRPSRVAEMDQSLKAPAMRHAPDALIAQIRRSTSIMMRKDPRESVAQESQSPPQAVPLDRERPVREVPQPIVIVNRRQPQRHTTPAFWERSYLSRLLRVRPLR